MAKVNSCRNCYFMYWTDEDTMDEMDCTNGNATPENNAPSIIDDEPNNCPFHEDRDFKQKTFDLLNIQIAEAKEQVKGLMEYDDVMDNRAEINALMGILEVLVGIKRRLEDE